MSYSGSLAFIVVAYPDELAREAYLGWGLGLSDSQVYVGKTARNVSTDTQTWELALGPTEALKPSVQAQEIVQLRVPYLVYCNGMPINIVKYSLLGGQVQLWSGSDNFVARCQLRGGVETCYYAKGWSVANPTGQYHYMLLNLNAMEVSVELQPIVHVL